MSLELMLAQDQAQGSYLLTLLPFLLIFGVFYLLILRPTRVRQKNHEKLIAELKNGDKVITAGGIYGTISGVRDLTVVVKVGDQTKLEIAKSSVVSLQVNREGSPPSS